MLLSVIVPVYNESAGIEAFHKNLLMPGIQAATKSFEIIYVNDGSRDDSLLKLQRIAKGKKEVRLVNLSRNFGKEIAVTAGISVSKGNATIILDADGQHPPKLIGDFIKEWKNGAQVVVGVRDSNQKEGLIKRWGSKLFYKLFNRLSDTPLKPRSTDFRLIDSLVRDEFLKCSEKQRITRGIIDWLGFKRTYVHFHSPARLAGDASYTTRQLFKLAVNSVVSLTLKPLLWLGWAGGFITCLALFTGLAIFIEQYLLNDPLGLQFTGSALLGIFITFLVGLILISESIIALYLSHIYGQAQGRPLFIIDRSQSKNL